jgi:hypothetical protein
MAMTVIGQFVEILATVVRKTDRQRPPRPDAADLGACEPYGRFKVDREAELPID